MGSFVFNEAKGRTVELYNRVKGNDPAASAFIILVVNRNVGGTAATDDTMRGYNTVLDLLNDVNVNEVTNGGTPGYGRKTLTDADLAALPAADDTNDRRNLDFPDQSWSLVAAGDPWSDMIVAYDADTATGTDTNLIPVSCHTLVVVPGGSTITARIADDGFYSAT